MMIFRDADWLTKFSQKTSKVLAIFILRFGLILRPSMRCKQTQMKNTYIKSTDNKNFRNLSHLSVEQVQWHTCYVTIQLCPGGVDNDALLELKKISIFFMSNNFEIFSFHVYMTTSSYMLHRCKHLHAMQGLSSQPRDVGMFLKTGFPESLGAANVAKVALSTGRMINYTRHDVNFE